MKKISWLLAFTLLLATGCKEKKETEKKKISKRDISINKSNAYNDLFLDSMDVVKYIEENNLAEDTARRMISFYNTRNYEFAWFSTDGLSEQAMGFSSLLNLDNDTSKIITDLQKTLNQYLGTSNPGINGKSKQIINTELLMTENLIIYTLEHYEEGYVKRKEMERFIPFKKQNPLEEADSLIHKKHNDGKYFMDVNEAYRGLLENLTKYVTLAKGNTWRKINTSAKLKKGDKNPEILNIKTNLFLAGDMELDSTDVYDENLESGIKNFQQRIGQTPDGKIDADVLKMLNISPVEMIEKIMINMNRMRWLPQKPDGRLLMVNIPAFQLHVYENGKEQFAMPVVVGKEGHNTVLFSDKLTDVVFSPYWNVPPSIVKNEILPGIEKNPNYLADHNMESTGTTNGLPDIRQLPGPKNSLGKVKFLFPNSFNIYFHDTPAKSLFQRDERAYSHGCIRLGEPERLAEWVLSNQPEWTKQKIEAAMNAGTEKWVKVKDPIPVMITYYTAWVTDGKLNLRQDIYGHDAEVMKNMFK